MVAKLSPHATLTKRAGPIVLCIMDGVGIGRGERDDAVASARTPNLDRLMASCPTRRLLAHGTAVGMPSDKDLGNSEVGHTAMGAGRVFDQGAKLADIALASGAAWKTEVWRKLVEGRTLHLLGLVSDGNVHSHIDHLNALIERAAEDGVKRLRVHMLTDGRDVAARSALTWVEPLQARLAELSEQRAVACQAHVLVVRVRQVVKPEIDGDDVPSRRVGAQPAAHAPRAPVNVAAVTRRVNDLVVRQRGGERG